MHILKILITFTLLLFLVTNGTTQRYVQLENLGHNKYSDGTEVAKLHAFGFFYEGYETGGKLFRRFDRTRKTQKAINYTGLALIGAGLATFALALDDNNNNTEALGIVLAVFAITASGALVMIVGNSILIPIKAFRKRKLLKYDFNEVGIKEKASLQFSLSKNGAGISVLF